MRVGLIGNDLKNNFTKEVSEAFGLEGYVMQEMGLKSLIELIQSKNFEGINVTFPYKKDVARHIDVMSEHAKKIGAVDTIVVRDGKTYGYNTDYEAFIYMIGKHNIDLKDKKVLIIGNGGTSAAVQLVAQDLGAREVHIVDIVPSENSISYVECYAKHLDSEIVINACPVGMSPKIEEEPIEMKLFSKCEALIEIIYNPILTKLGLDAQENGIKRVIGIEMLVAQTKAAVQLIKGVQISDEKLDEVIQQTIIKNTNIVLIGMPSAGKTTIGHMLEARLQKQFIDMDDVVVKDTKMRIPDIFAHSGEAGFRKLETLTAMKLSRMNNVIIGTGGGTIKNKINMDFLRLNGIIIFIDRDLENLISSDPNRPLSSSQAAVAKLYEERYPIYQKYATAIIPNNDNIEDSVNEIIEAYYKTCRDAIRQ
ncbi:MAG: shikimate dehydrogenase [Firmicutes bacterium]|nr:shikimate dehydrogenase [Bacillota bacterium]